MEVVEVRNDLPGLRHELREESLVDQLLQADGVRYLVEEVLRLAYESALEAVRRRGHSDEPDLRVDLPKPLDERPVHALVVRLDHVRLVDNADVAMAEYLGFGIHGLDARNYRGRVGVVLPEACGVHPRLDVGR